LGTPPRSSADSRPNYLFVGRRDRYKNFWLLLEALVLCRTQYRDGILPFTLQVLGAPFTPEESNRLAELNLLGTVVWEPVLDDDTLRQFYRRSLALVFPSLWEGFGLPLLEALAAGTCVIGSEIPVFRELVGEGFEPFDPNDAESLANALQRIFLQPDLRARRIAIGSSHLIRYSWQSTAVQTRAIYQQIVDAR
jgi:glycosyltransferase involved in cell wall biosynthesis